MKTFKVIGGILLTLLLSGLVQGSLGTFVASDTVSYTVVCVTDEGDKDIGCSGSDDDILDSTDTVARSPTVALAEVSDANFPGLWRGSYLIPAGDAPVGVWSIFIELTNSNGTTAATTLSFQVVESNSGFGNLSDKLDTIDANMDLVLADTGTDGVVIAAAQTVATCTAVTDDVGITATAVDNIWGEDVSAYTSPKVGYYVKELYDNQTSFVTATGFSTLTASDNIGINWADISNPTTGVDLSETVTKTVDTCSALTANNDKTGYTLSSQDWTTNSDLTSLCQQTNLTSGILVLNSATEAQVDNIEADTNELQLNQTSFITATGFSTHSATDVWTTGSRELSTPNNYKADVSALATTTELAQNTSAIITHGDLYWNSTSSAGLATQDNITDLETHGDANWLTATGFETEVTALSRYTNITALIQGLNNLSASDVWDYATKLITGGSLTTPNDYKADVSSLATTAELAQNTTAIINHGDLYWNSSIVSDFMTQDNYTDLKTHGDSGWATATGFETETNANTRHDVVVANFTDVVEHGDLYWNESDESTMWDVTLASNKTANDTLTFIYDDLVYGGGGGW